MFKLWRRAKGADLESERVPHFEAQACLMWGSLRQLVRRERGLTVQQVQYTAKCVLLMEARFPETKQQLIFLYQHASQMGRVELGGEIVQAERDPHRTWRTGSCYQRQNVSPQRQYYLTVARQ